MPSTLARLYRVFQIIDPLLLIAGLAGVLVWWPDDLWVKAWCWPSGYSVSSNTSDDFAIRLSYPASEWVAKVRQQRLPRLVKDLRLANR